jgi:hypothetical protein
VIERSIGLRNYIESGIPIDARLTYDLLVSIFQPTSPLHDGAVIVQGDRLAAAACFLPLTVNPPQPRLGRVPRGDWRPEEKRFRPSWCPRNREDPIVEDATSNTARRRTAGPACGRAPRRRPAVCSRRGIRSADAYHPFRNLKPVPSGIAALLGWSWRASTSSSARCAPVELQNSRKASRSSATC